MKYPITPAYLAAVPDPIVGHYEDLEDYIIKKICDPALILKYLLDLVKFLQAKFTVRNHVIPLLIAVFILVTFVWFKSVFTLMQTPFQITKPDPPTPLIPSQTL